VKEEEMRKFQFLLVTLILVVLSIELVPAEETKYHFRVSTYLMQEDEKGLPACQGGFTVPQNRYGRVSITYYNDGKRIGITAAGDVQGPVTRLISERGPRVTAGEILFAADLYLKGSPAPGKSIHVKGVMTEMSRAEAEGSPLFEYSERKLDFVLPSNGKNTILISDEYDGKQIYLDITVGTDAEMINKEKMTHHVSFDTEYYLYNQDAKRYELEGKDCVLGMDLDTSGEETTCFWEKIYALSGGDSLLYMVVCAIRNPRFRGSEKIKFELEISHIYALNPVTEEPWPEELRSDKTTVILFSKEITAAFGERTEIEIPQEKDSLLPFKSKETIVLKNSVKEIRE
jgi:hypothetical protein